MRQHLLGARTEGGGGSGGGSDSDRSSIDMSATVSSLFPRAKKLEYDLKVQLEQLESGRSSSYEDGQRAMQNSNELAELVSQLESLLNYEQAGKRDMWRM